MQILLVQERFLERAATLDLKHCLIWKGGSLLLRRYSSIQPPRFTTDLDLLIRGTTISDTIQLLSRAAKTELDDGFTFVFKKQTPMKRDTPYGGERLEISWALDGKPNSEPLRIDLCAGDDVDVLEVKLESTFIDSPLSQSLAIHVYPPEFIFTEKLETVARFGTGNTRLKDFIDLWTLIHADLKQDKLRSAISRCYSRRGSELDLPFLARIFADRDFADELERARQRNYPDLPIPNVHDLFRDVLSFVKKTLV